MTAWGSHTDNALRALLQQVALRDKAAFRALYHALYPQLSRYLYRLIRCSEEVEELLNDVMWVVWEKAGEFRGDAQVTTWVLGIATLKSRRWYRRWYRHQEISDLQQLQNDAEKKSIAEDVNFIDDHSLTQGLAQLSAEHREAVELAYYFGYSCEEIAQIVSCPVGTVKTRLHYARKRLRQLLEADSLTCVEIL